MSEGIDFKKIFGEGAKFMLDIFKGAVIDKFSQTQVAQDEIERQKLLAGKNMLWSYFPFVIIGVVAITLIARFK